MTNQDRKKQADRILYEFGLLEHLSEIGAAHLIGSYRMDMMAWNDLDLDIENDAMSLDKLHRLSEYILRTFRPVWYEAREDRDPAGRPVWFHGFETTVTGELWNVDLWFFDRETIRRAERHCDAIASAATPAQRDSITAIKRELIARGLYSFEQYTSQDVYRAVLERRVGNIGEFLREQSASGQNPGKKETEPWEK